MSSFIAKYWEAVRSMTDEQYRETNQTLRSVAITPHSSGNTRGTAADINACAQAQQGAFTQGFANQGALQGMSQSPLPHGPPPGLGYSYTGGGHSLAGLQQLVVTSTGTTQSLVGFSYPAVIPPPEPLIRGEPVAGEIIGHRAWVVIGKMLRSMSYNTVWEPGQLMCDTSAAGQSITDHGTAGVWAFKDPHELVLQFGRDWAYNSMVMVFGTVWMWGTVIEHERGYRSQYAAIRSLDLAGTDCDLGALRRIYLPAG